MSSPGQPLSPDPYALRPTAAGGRAPATGATAAGGRGSSGDRGPSTTGTAKDQAAGVASDAAQAGQRVAGTAKDQASDVVGEARTQARDLLGQTRTQLSEQTTAGQQRAASGLGSLAGELKDLAEGKGGDGMVTDLAHRASQRLDGAASWLGDREPADVLREVQDFARRRPVAFLAIAAGAGLVAGRLTRGLTAAAHEDASDDGQTGRHAAAPAPGFDVDAADRATSTPAPPASSPTPLGDTTSSALGGGPVTGAGSWDRPLR